MKLEQDIKQLIDKFDGTVSVYASDGKTEIKINENMSMETASCIKAFILVEYYRQILSGEKSREDMMEYCYDKDYLKDGSGIIQFLDNGMKITSRNMAILMIIVSDNIATDKLIEYLGYDRINETIRELGFTQTKLNSKTLDFDQCYTIGQTTAYEYARLYKLLLEKKILSADICEEIIKVLASQQLNSLLIKNISPKDIHEKGMGNAYIKYIASKSGGLGNENEKITSCRNDGGIVSTQDGEYIVSIFTNNLGNVYFYEDNPAIILGSKIHGLIYDDFKQNKGKFSSI